MTTRGGGREEKMKVKRGERKWNIRDDGELGRKVISDRRGGYETGDDQGRRRKAKSDQG